MSLEKYRNEVKSRDQSENSPESIADIARGSWQRKSVDEIRSTGFVVDTLESAFWAVGTNHGTEFTSNAILAWAKDAGIEWHYIEPGKPTQNGGPVLGLMLSYRLLFARAASLNGSRPSVFNADLIA